MSTPQQAPPVASPSQPLAPLQLQSQPLLLLDEYFLLEEVGRGSFATVHRGQSRSTLATVAVKVIPMDKLSKKLRANLNSEIAILHSMAKMSHPHIVNLIAWERHDGPDSQSQKQASSSGQPPLPSLSKLRAVYLVMDWCAWGDLSQFLRTKTKRSHGTMVTETALSSIADRILEHPTVAIPLQDLPLAGPWGGLYHTFTFYLLGQLVSALDFLRAHSLMHRDLKPQNLLLHPPPITSGLFPLNEIGSGATRFHPLSVNEGSASSDTLRELAIGILPRLPILKLADFGFARYLPTPTSLAETLCGSPLYMAPEILRYEKYDTRADLWSVGAVLYEMLFGRVPFRAQNHVELLRKIEKYKDKLRFPKGSVPPDEVSRSSSGASGAVPIPTPRNSAALVSGDGSIVAHSAPSAFRLPERMMAAQTTIASSPPDRSATPATPHRPADNRAPSPDDPETAISTVAPLHMLPDEMHLIMNLLRQRPVDRFSLEQFFEHKVVKDARGLADAVRDWQNRAVEHGTAVLKAATPPTSSGNQHPETSFEPSRPALAPVVNYSHLHQPPRTSLPAATPVPLHAFPQQPPAAIPSRQSPPPSAPIPIAQTNTRTANISQFRKRDHSVSPSPPDGHVRPMSLPAQPWTQRQREPSLRARVSSGLSTVDNVHAAAPSDVGAVEFESSLPAPVTPTAQRFTGDPTIVSPLRKTPSVGQLLLQRRGQPHTPTSPPQAAASPIGASSADKDDYVLVERDLFETHGWAGGNSRAQQQPQQQVGPADPRRESTGGFSSAPPSESPPTRSPASARPPSRRSSFSLLNFVGKLITTTSAAIQSSPTSSPASAVAAPASPSRSPRVPTRSMSSSAGSPVPFSSVPISSFQHLNPASNDDAPMQSIPTFDQRTSSDPQVNGLVLQLQSFARQAWALSKLTQSRMDQYHQLVAGPTSTSQPSTQQAVQKLAREVMSVADIALCIIVIATERYRTFMDAVGFSADQEGVLDSPTLHRGPTISPTELRPLTFVVSYLRQFYNRVVDQLQYVTSQSISLAFLDDGYFGDEQIAPAQRIVFMEAIGLVDYAMTCEDRERIIYVLQTALFLFEALLVHADHTGSATAAGAILDVGTAGGIMDEDVSQGLSEEDMITVTLYTTQLSNRLTRLMSAHRPM